MTFRSITSEGVIEKDVEAGGNFEIQSVELEIITYNKKSVEVKFEEEVVKSFQWFFNIKVSGKTANITKIFIKEDESHQKSAEGNDILYNHIDGEVGHPD